MQEKRVLGVGLSLFLLTQPVLSTCMSKPVLVLVPSSVKIHRAIHPSLEDLERGRGRDGQREERKSEKKNCSLICSCNAAYGRK